MDPMAIAAMIGTRQTPSRAGSFQAMLDAEKRARLERLQSETQSAPGTPPPRSPHGHPPLQLRRSDSSSDQQNNMMLQATRKGYPMPPLSIQIPPNNVNGGSSKVKKKWTSKVHEMDSDHDNEVELDHVLEDDDLTPEPFHKSVKFLGADDDLSEGESIQSSICHSPSWEGYGQKKKDKKKEAERKRKEKEQGEKDARNPKKKILSRLSKQPPPPVRPLHLLPAAMERANSAPVLASRRSMPAPIRAYQLPDIQDEVSNDNMQSHLAHKGFVGGLKLEREKGAAFTAALDQQFTTSPHRAQFVSSPTQDIGQPMHKSHSASPAMIMAHPPRAVTHPPTPGRHETRSPRESRPPSASRTPMLVQTSTNRPQNLPTNQGRAPKVEMRQNYNAYVTSDHEQDSYRTLPSHSERGRPYESYVRRQRDQSTERAMAGLADEQLYEDCTPHSSTRSSSRQTLRSAGSQEAYTTTAKPSGHKSSSSSKIDQPGDPIGVYRDHFPFPEDSLSRKISPSDDAFRAGSSEVPPRAASTNSQENSAQASGSSSTSGKARSVKDVAKAVFQRPSSTQPAHGGAIKVPPYYKLRERLSSSSTMRTAMTPKESPLPPNNPPSKRAYQNTNVQKQQPGSRVSEGSSSSSNYDDVSPIPSPATTPDTSRPQSARGHRLTLNQGSSGSLEHFMLQDDQITLRPTPSEDDEETNLPESAEQAAGEEDGVTMTADDRWSRTALPMDVDFQPQPNTPASMVNDAILKGNHAGPEQQIDETVDLIDLSDSQPNQAMRVRSFSDADLHQLAMDMSFLPPLRHQPFSPRHAKGRRSSAERPSTAMADHHYETERHYDQEPDVSSQRLFASPSPAQSEAEAEDDIQTLNQTTSLDSISPSNVVLSPSSVLGPANDFTSSLNSGNGPIFVDIGGVGNNLADPSMVPVKVTTTQITLQTHMPATTASTALLNSASNISPVLKQTRSLTASDVMRKTSRSTVPASKPGSGPISILKPSPPQSTTGPTSDTMPLAKQHVLSAVPKHLQQHPSARAPVSGPPEVSMAPIAKMFVECCSCHFYHDMPSKLYECMAKPDAVVEDRLLGISGAITTMVKCPWCAHNMSTKCCAGYAAVVYRKERLH